MIDEVDKLNWSHLNLVLFTWTHITHITHITRITHITHITHTNHVYYNLI